MNIHGSVIYNSVKPGSNLNFHQLVNEQTKYNSVQSYNGTLFSKEIKINGGLTHVTIWMNLKKPYAKRKK